MIEFALILPLIALLCAALTTLSIALVQLHTVTDASRQGARIHSAMTTGTPSCTTIEFLAANEASSFQIRYSAQTQMLNLLLPWNSPNASVQTSSWDGYNFQHVAIDQGTTTGSCLLCMMGLNWPMNTAPRSTFLMEGSCT